MSAFTVLHPYLQQQLQAKQLFHAYVFSGSEAAEQARALSASLECLNPRADGTACGSCHACRNIQLNVHPDVRWLEPQGAQHKVEAMRELVANAGLGRMAGAFKVYILDQAENITLEGANTLLKLLEEPVSNTVLILLAEQPDQLLPTILSRCQQFSFGAERETVAPDGELRESAFSFLTALPQLPIYQLLQRARDYEKDRSGQSAFLFAMLECLHERAKGESSLCWSRSAALAAAELLEQAIDQLDRGMNQKLLMDVTYLQLRQICVQ